MIFLGVLWLINLAVALIGYMAPGNSSRYTVEMISFAGYNMYNFAEKIILGLQLFIMYFYSFRGLLMWMIPSCIIIAVSLYKRSYRNMIAPAINILLSGIQNILIRKVFNLEFLHPFDLKYVLWLVFGIALLFYNGSIILKASKKREECFWLLFTYYGLVTAGIIVCISPTLYVSAGRTMYISYIFLLMIIMLMLRSVCMPGEAHRKELRGWKKLNGIAGGCVSIVLAVLFVLGCYTVKTIPGTSVALSSELVAEDLTIDQEKGTLAATVNVDPFLCTVDNWCSGELDGYAININAGVLDQETETLYLYRTYIHPQYPVMKEYPENQVQLTGYLRDACTLEENQQFVLVYTDPEGEMWYTPLS